MSIPRFHAERGASVRHCEFMCLDCHKGFLKTLTGHDYEEGVVTCPHCGGSRVELRIVLPAKARRKSA
jgi:DNA-directed RNA polymerase subunit RPC12/RpoP